jgi:hypothetical protein
LQKPQKLPVARLFAEGLVIVVGVLVALGVDRWVMALDESARASFSSTQLIENLVAESARVSDRIATAEERGGFALRLLRGERTPGVTSEAFLAAVETVAWWAPTEFSRETWDDLIATGRLNTLHDAELRQSLSAYYNRIEWLALLEADWDAQLEEYEGRARDLLPPLKRLQALGRLRGGDVELTDDDVDDVLRRLSAESDLATDLSQVVLIYSGQARRYESFLVDIGGLLRLLRGAL